MTSSPIEEIKNRIDVVELIQQYLKLQKAGINYRGVCPFHSEKKPSFFVSPARQIWHCFGCQAGGDIFKFIMMIEGTEFKDALRLLAQKAGVELKKEDPKIISERHRLYDICELATRFFEKQLESATGQTVKKYLLDRGITEESIKKWRLGYAPETWQGLSDFLVGQGYKREEEVKAGLTVAKGGSDFFDRFRSRIMFPVFDLNSQVIGFGGRIFGSDEFIAKAEQTGNGAKYVNTPATMLYDKSNVLYGLDKAKLDIRKKDACLLVEGYMDAIMVSQAGFQNVVAASGTALTLNQLKTLKRYSSNLLSAFDMDIAGNSATDRGIDLAQAYGFNVRVITMPVGLDPADVIQKDEKEWKSLAENSKSIIEYYFENALSKYDPKTPEGKKDISKIILPKISIVP
ncbi:MAG: DNA primase, partial [Candidatus Parcubacteria bacterium]|nr:DNA primase [Candidatus Parcubacteria bacterium]